MAARAVPLAGVTEPELAASEALPKEVSQPVLWAKESLASV